MKKLIILIAVYLVCQGLADAATLSKIRFGYYPEKIRAVFYLDSSFSYQSDEYPDKIVIHFNDTTAGSDINNYVELDDLVVRHLEIENNWPDLTVTIPLSEPIEYNVFSLNDPSRLVIDFGREYINIVSGGSIADGIEFLKIKKGTPAGRINATVLKVDMDKTDVFPALAKKYKPNILESFVSLVAPWNRKGDSHFYLDKVSNIAADNNALAGINGTYFAYTGTPLGALVIDQELVTYPIYDRTSLIIDEDSQAFIDNVFIYSFFSVKDSPRYNISGINRHRNDDDIIIYSPAWGQFTQTDEEGLELVVKGSRIAEINLGNSEIPENGYVISVSGSALTGLTEQVKVGNKVESHIKIVPYAVAPDNIIHLISGGPRLLKKGRVYVSKHEENFRVDIAKGRAARTAVGVTKDNKLLLITVDGPHRQTNRDKSPSSIGVSLEELSELLLNLGAVEAMNLDGGSSSTMVINGETVNNPVSGFQRRVSNAILVKPRY
ncbi:MAG: phosphodiester glycosidase family protein [bacterium]